MRKLRRFIPTFIVAVLSVSMFIILPASGQAQTTEQVDCVMNNFTAPAGGPFANYKVGESVNLQIFVTDDPGPELLSYFVLSDNRLNEVSSRTLTFKPTAAGTYVITGEFYKADQKLTVKKTESCKVTLVFDPAPDPDPDPEPPPTTTTIPPVTTTVPPQTTTTTVPPATPTTTLVTTTTTEPPPTTTTTEVQPPPTTLDNTPTTQPSPNPGDDTQVAGASDVNAVDNPSSPVAAEELPRTGISDRTLKGLSLLALGLITLGVAAVLGTRRKATAVQ